MPPYLSAAARAKKTRGQAVGTGRKGKADGAEEGDLMIGFVELKRALEGSSGEHIRCDAS
jgi:hypothetical protein